MTLMYSHMEIFRVRVKEIYCEAAIYVNPPRQHNHPIMYKNSKHDGNILKEPVWIRTAIYEEHRYKFNFINTVPKYALLICQGLPNGICQDSSHQQWLGAMLMHPNLVRYSETVLVLLTKSSNPRLFVLCLHCNPCNPLELAEIMFKKFIAYTLLNQIRFNGSQAIVDPIQLK